MIGCACGSNRKELVASTQRHNTPEVPLGSLTATSNNISGVNAQHNDHSYQSGYREGNSNDAGRYTNHAFCSSITGLSIIGLHNNSCLLLLPYKYLGAKLVIKYILSGREG